MNHLLGPYTWRRPHWWSPRRRRTRATNIPGRNVSMTPRNIQKAAMDSPVFDYVVFYFLLNNIYVGQWSEGLPRFLNPYTNWRSDSWSCSTLKLNTSSAWWPFASSSSWCYIAMWLSRSIDLVNSSLHKEHLGTVCFVLPCFLSVFGLSHV